MQNRYAGDIGDYLKLALLRTIVPPHKLGIAWWLYPDEAHNSDGRHIDYLNHPARWRSIDPELFDALADTVRSGSRSVEALEQMGVLPGATFFRRPCSFDGNPPDRRSARADWFAELMEWAADRDLVFADPDNGIEPSSFSAGQRRAGKSITVAEIKALAVPGRTVIVYHHQTRMRGGHLFEIDHWRQRLKGMGLDRIDAVRAAPYSARVFFVINATDPVRDIIRHAIGRWTSKNITWHPSD